MSTLDKLFVLKGPKNYFKYSNVIIELKGLSTPCKFREISVIDFLHTCMYIHHTYIRTSLILALPIWTLWAHPCCAQSYLSSQKSFCEPCIWAVT